MAAKKAATKVRTPKTASEILSGFEGILEHLADNRENDISDIQNAVQNLGDAEDEDELRDTVDEMDPSELLKRAQADVAVLEQAVAFYKANRERLIAMVSAESFITCPHCYHAFNKSNI